MDKLGLLLGKSYDEIGNILVRNPTLNDIYNYYKDLGMIEEEYNRSVFLITAMEDLEPIAHILLAEHKIWYKDLDPWKFFIELYQTDEFIKTSFNWWTQSDFTIVEDDADNNDIKLFLYNPQTKGVINNKTFFKIIQYIKQVNYLPLVDKSRPNFGKRDATAKRYYLSKYDRYKNKRNENNSDLASKISAIACRMQCSPSELLNYTMYQIQDRYHRIAQVDNYKNYMLGYYTGTMKKKDINFREIDWAKTIIIDRTKDAESGSTTFTVANG